MEGGAEGGAPAEAGRPAWLWLIVSGMAFLTPLLLYFSRDCLFGDEPTLRPVVGAENVTENDGVATGSGEAGGERGGTEMNGVREGGAGGEADEGEVDEEREQAQARRGGGRRRGREAAGGRTVGEEGQGEAFLALLSERRARAERALDTSREH